MESFSLKASEKPEESKLSGNDKKNHFCPVANIIGYRNTRAI